MSTPGDVGIAEPDAPSKLIDNVELLNALAVLVQRQVISIGDPEAWGRLAGVALDEPAADAAGLVVRPVPDNYDSGLVAVPAVEAQLTDTDTKVTAIFLSNQTSTKQWVTVKNDAGTAYLNQFPLDPRQALVLGFHGMLFASGIRWLAKTAAAVHAQVVGKQPNP